MRSIILSGLILCSLTLLWGCSPPASQDGPEVVAIQPGEIMGQVKSSAKPYVVVNFYATWCKPCRSEIPELLAARNQENSMLDVILVSVDDIETDERKLANFLGQYAVDFRSFHLSPDSALAFIKKLNPAWPGTIPVNFIYTSKGRLVEVTGLTDQKELWMIVRQDQFLPADRLGTNHP